MAGNPTGMDTLQRLLPGGTFITFTVLAQITTDSDNLAKRYADCLNLKAAGKDHYTACQAKTVCGGTGYALTLALVAVTAVICLILGWWNASIDAKETKNKQKEVRYVIKEIAHGVKAAADATKAAASAATDTLAKMEQQNAQDPGGLQQPLQSSTSERTLHPQDSMISIRPPGSSLPAAEPTSKDDAGNQGGAKADTPDPLQSTALDGKDKSPARACLEKVIRALGGTAIFLVLALFTPPVSTCLLPYVDKQVITVVPLVVAFFVSGLLVVLDRLLNSLLHYGEPVGGVIFFFFCGPIMAIWGILKQCLPMSALSGALGNAWKSSQATFYAALLKAPPHFCADKDCRGSAHLICCDWCGCYWHKGCAYPADRITEPSDSTKPIEAGVAAAGEARPHATLASDHVPQPPGGWLCPHCNNDQHLKVVSEGICLHAKWVLSPLSQGQIRLLTQGRLAIQFADYVPGQEVEQYENPEELRQTFEAAQRRSHSRAGVGIVEHCPSQELWDMFRRKGWLQMPRAVPAPAPPSVPAAGAATAGVPATGAAARGVSAAAATTAGVPAAGAATPSVPATCATTRSIPAAGAAKPSMPAAGAATPGVPADGAAVPSAPATSAHAQQTIEAAASSSMLQPATGHQTKPEPQVTGAATGMVPADSNETQPPVLIRQSMPPTPSPPLEQQLQLQPELKAAAAAAAAAVTPPGPNRAAPSGQGQDMEAGCLTHFDSVTR